MTQTKFLAKEAILRLIIEQTKQFTRNDNIAKKHKLKAKTLPKMITLEEITQNKKL